MEIGQRKRSRKSQSFKLVTDEVKEPSLFHNDAVRELKDTPAVEPDDWLGHKDMEIKRQITGMMRVLSERSSRVYQRTEQSQDRGVSWGQAGSLLPPPDHHHNTWNSASMETSSSITSSLTNGLSIHSRALRHVNSTKDSTKASQVNDTDPPCCMCNCKDTLQAILQELRVMRKLMQSQKEKQEVVAASPCQPHLPGPAPRHRSLRRRPVYKVSPLTVSSVRWSAEDLPTTAESAQSGTGRESEKEAEPFSADLQSISELTVEVRADKETPTSEYKSLLNQPTTQLAPESEVRLSENYDVFISKAQLDSILINYTRSGSLLFRKLVCAFFDDATLATSLPNGKRKRGLNDNRKGLDQNVVGAIKAFTEKYCTDHKIDKLPGPRDWVQILQDQIKLARRRLKRDAAEDGLNGPSSSVNI